MNNTPDDIAPPDLARMTVELFIRERKKPSPPLDPQGILGESAGVFVTLRTTDGQLRGCIGTIEAQCANVAEEIIENAVSAATRDPRFSPVIAPELDRLTYGVDVLSAPERVSGPEDLDPSRYGVIIESQDGSRRGLLLPRIETINTAQEQWLAVHHKAGIRPGAPVRVERFTVSRFGKD